MRRLLRVMLAIPTLSLVMGCGVRTVKLREFDLPPKTDPMKVEVFTSDAPPTKPYTRLATMHENSGDYEEVVNGFRRRAAQLGADAVIVNVHTYDQKTSGIFGGQYENTKLEGTATAIQWEPVKK